MSIGPDKITALLRQISPIAQMLHLPKVLAGDVDAAEDMCRYLVDEHLTQLTPLLYDARVPSPVFRFILHRALVSSLDFRNTIKAAGSREHFVEWCRYASFELPNILPDRVTIYRGTFGCSAAAASEGLHWSFSFNMAAWFALRRERRYPGEGEPLVISAYVPKSSLVFYSDMVGHQEVIPETAPTEYRVNNSRWCLEDGAKRAVEFFMLLGALKVKPERLREMQADPSMQPYLQPYLQVMVRAVDASFL